MLRTLAAALLMALTLSFTLSSYSASVSKKLAYMSDIAYEPTSKINAWSCTQCSQYKITDPQAFTAGEMQGFTGYSESLKSIVVAFRGSSNIDNWVKNTQVIWTDFSKCSKCKVHGGFKKYADSVKDVVVSHIQKLIAKYGKIHVYITGHSLGGAVAVINSLEIKGLFSNPMSLYTYGQPRVGNDELAKYIGSTLNLHRMVHYADFVPHLLGMAFGYRHGGTEVWYDQPMRTYKICEAESNSCSNSLTFYNIGDHSMDKYYIQLPGDWVEYLKGMLMGVVEVMTLRGQQLTTAQ